MKLETGRAGADLSDSTINYQNAYRSHKGKTNTHTHTCQQKCFELMDTKDHGSVSQKYAEQKGGEDF